MRYLWVLALFGCDDDGGGGGDAGAGGIDLNMPSCADVEAFVQLRVEGAETVAVEWGPADFIECDGARIEGPNLLYDIREDTSFWVKLTDPGDFVVGADLPAEANLNYERGEDDLLLGWDDCVARITEVTEVSVFDNGGPFVGHWERVAGSVRCDVPDQPLLADGDYTLGETGFRGIYYRLAPR